MNKHEAAVIGAYTGILLGSFHDLHCYIEEILQRPVLTHEMANPATMDEIKKASRSDFLQICKEITE